MTWTVNGACIKCKYMDCVEVCPVDCFYEGENMLVINPDECIDCGVCEPECPADAIYEEGDERSKEWNDLNYELSTQWPNVSKKKQCYTKEEQDKWKDVPDKKKYLSKKPAPPEVIKDD